MSAQQDGSPGGDGDGAGFPAVGPSQSRGEKYLKLDLTLFLTEGKFSRARGESVSACYPAAGGLPGESGGLSGPGGRGLGAALSQLWDFPEVSKAKDLLDDECLTPELLSTLISSCWAAPAAATTPLKCPTWAASSGFRRSPRSSVRSSRRTKVLLSRTTAPMVRMRFQF